MISRETKLNLVLCAAAVAFSLLLGEALARLFLDPAPVPLEPQVRYAPHPVRSFTLERCQQAVYSGPALATVGCNGLRVNGLPTPPETKLRILALGDSFTFGLGVADDETWPSRLQALLSQDHALSAEVFNAGTVSYGVFQESDLLRELLTSNHYDHVIHGLYWNDYQNAKPRSESSRPVLAPDGHFVWNEDDFHKGRLITLGRLIYGKSSLGTLLWRRVKALSRPPVQPATGYAAEYRRLIASELDQRELAPIRDFYLELADLEREHGFSALVVVFPVLDLVTTAEYRDNSYYTYVIDILQRTGLPYVDAFEIWDQGKLTRRHFQNVRGDTHFNARGYRVIAEVLADRVVSLRANARAAGPRQVD